MTNKNFSIIEGKKHKILFNLTNVENQNDFQVFGFFKKIGCCNSVFQLEQIDNESYIPELENGSYTYQIFIKQLSTKKDFLALEGKLEVKNSLMVENNSVLGGTELEITFDSNTTEIHCEIGQGLRGEKGDKGEKGEKGEDGTNLLSKNNTWTGNNFFNYGIKALPLGNNLYGLSVSTDDGLQLWGTHFLQGDAHADNTLKIAHNSISLGSADFAAIGFDYANTVTFRTFPNDGSTANDSAGGVYRFEAWQWADDSHTSKKEMAVDVRKPNAGMLCDESLLNRAEVDAEITQKIPLAYQPDSTAPAPLAPAPYLGCFALGQGANASGSYCIAIGDYSKSDFNGGVALGYKTKCSGGVAIGYNVNSSGNSSVGVGRAAKAPGAFGVAIGYEAQTNGMYSTAIGPNARNENNEAIAIGRGAYNTGKYSTAIGFWASLKDDSTIEFSTGFRSEENVNYVYNTRFYIMAAGSELANKYENGAACMGYVVREGNTIVECGTRKLSEIFTNNTAFTPASMDLDAPAPTPFMPTGITDPIEIPEEITE